MWPVGKIGTRLVGIDSKWQGKFLLVITGIFIEEVFDGFTFSEWPAEKRFSNY